MQEEAILIGISQLAAVFVGFIAIFLVFTQSNGKFTAIDAVRARIIVYSGFAVVLASLLPLVFHGLDVPSEWLWQLSTALYLVIGGLITLSVIRHQSNLDDNEEPSRTVRNFRLIARTLNMLLFVVGALVLIGIGDGGYYVLMLVMNLVMAATSFLSFAIHRLFE